MDIGKRIFELLYFKDCVIIPGLGGFVSHYVPARIREESQTFVPPAKKIGFNRELIQDDGMLSAYLSKSDKISISAARLLLHEFVNSLMEKLASDGELRLNSIGKFKYLKTGELVFIADKETNFLPDSYGLSSFHFTRPQQNRENPLLRSAMYKHSERGKVITLPGLSKPEWDKSLRRVAMVIPLLLAVSLLPINSRIGQHTANIIHFPALSNVEMTNSVSVSGATGNLTDMEQEALDYSVSGENSKTNNQTSPIDRESFAIIAGSFSTENHALILKQALSDKGYNPEIWKADNGFFRVALEARKSMAEAQTAIIEFKKDLPEIEFWVLQ